MTEERARRIAELKARREAAAPVGSAQRSNVQARVRGPKVHVAKKSRYLALGLSVAATSGLVSGMWTQAALSNTAVSAAAADTKPVAAETAPQTTVYLVIHRPSSNAAADSLRSQAQPAPPTTVAPPPATVAPAPAPAPKPQPVTKSHGSK